MEKISLYLSEGAVIARQTPNTHTGKKLGHSNTKFCTFHVFLNFRNQTRLASAGWHTPPARGQGARSSVRPPRTGFKLVTRGIFGPKCHFDGVISFFSTTSPYVLAMTGDPGTKSS